MFNFYIFALVDKSLYFDKCSEITVKIQVMVGSFLFVSLYFQKYVNLQVKCLSELLIVSLSTEPPELDIF